MIVLGASRGAVDIDPSGVVVALAPTPHARAAALAAAPSVDSRWLLSLDGIAAQSPGSYDVYLLPANEAGIDAEGSFAGRLSLYGPRSSANARASTGFHFVLDVTAVVEALSAQGAWDAERARVRIVPAQQWPAPARVGAVQLLRG